MKKCKCKGYGAIYSNVWSAWMPLSGNLFIDEKDILMDCPSCGGNIENYLNDGHGQIGCDINKLKKKSFEEICLKEYENKNLKNE